ncbi:hypothetical protein LXL04_023656 [Taraxacum kok-saghyz]
MLICSINGVAAAYKLKVHGLNVTIFEAYGRDKWELRSISDHGLIWDELYLKYQYHGITSAIIRNICLWILTYHLIQTESNTFNTYVSSLIDDLGIRDKHRFISYCV